MTPLEQEMIGHDEHDSENYTDFVLNAIWYLLLKHGGSP